MKYFYSYGAYQYEKEVNPHYRPTGGEKAKGVASVGFTVPSSVCSIVTEYQVRLQVIAQTLSIYERAHVCMFQLMYLEWASYYSGGAWWGPQ
jgi:hypothetical protein